MVVDGLQMEIWLYRWDGDVQMDGGGLQKVYGWNCGFIDGMEMYRWFLMVYKWFIDGTMSLQMEWRCKDGP